MKDRQQIISLLASAKPELEERFQVKSLALFGSYARGKQRPGSDVDILVEVGPEIGLDFVTLADRIETIIGQPVEVVSRRSLKPKFFNSINEDLVNV